VTVPGSDKGMARRVILVPHTHWDREWYFTTRQSKVLLLESLAVVLDELEAGRLPVFVLDGQTSLLEDYLLNAPAERERIASLVRGGKLKIGPWYSQTDQCVVGGESILRNLLYGIRDCREFGGHMEIGYVPDSFGQSEQLPQMLAQFGLQRCVFWRGWWEGIHGATEFEWASRDGSSVTTAVIPTGYSGVKGMPADEGLQTLRFRHIRGHLETLRQRNTTSTTLLMAGTDQQPWDRRLPALITAENKSQDEYRYELGDIEQYFDVLDSEAKLEPVTAEMLMGKYSRIHRGIYSTRYDIKKANSDAETLITHVLEPLLCIGWSLGFPYPHDLLENAWKMLLKSHAHDSIGCCNSDEVNAAVKRRLTEALQICEQQLQLRMRQIAERIRPRQHGSPLVLFNPLPEARREPAVVELIVEEGDAPRLLITDGQGKKLPFQPLSSKAVHLSELVQDLGEALKPGQSGDPVYYRHRLLVDAGELPALGYTTLYVGEGGKAAPETCQATGRGEIENNQLRVTLADDCTITIRHKQGGWELSGLLEFVDGGDDGDNYDFSPPRDDWLISTRGLSPHVEVEQGTLRSSMKLAWDLEVPNDLESRAQHAKDGSLKVAAILQLDQRSDFVEVRIEVDNMVRDHRLQAVFHTGLDTDVSHADQPFGMITRPSNPLELAEWADGWTSKPLPLYPMQSLVAVSDGECGLAVITDGIREYESDPGQPGYVAITLFRSVGYMGKPNLLYRPGRLSGMPTATPDSQLQGQLQFRFALLPFNGEPGRVAKIARRFLSRVRAYHVSGHNKFSLNRGPADLPEHYSLMEFESGLPVSAVKKAEDSEALILRAFNPSLQSRDSGRLRLPAGSPLHGGRVLGANFAEQPGGSPIKEVKPQQAVTLLIDRSN
jgi:mannosylglycerate hydrolase